jgi:Tfp pilus assembly protein FimT
MRNHGFNAQSGKSITEVLIVLVVGAILVTTAVTRMGSAQSSMQRQNLASEFKVNLDRSRFDSIKRRPSDLDTQAKVKITSATSYTVTTDLNQNGILETFEGQAKDISATSTVKIISTTGSFPVTIRFDWRGKAVAYNTAEQPIPMPTFYFCEGTGCNASTATDANANIIFISPSGTVNMSKGGATLPTFLAPNVSNVNTNSGINPLVKVNSSY